MATFFDIVIDGGDEKDAERLLEKLRIEKKAAEKLVEEMGEVLEDCYRDFEYASRQYYGVSYVRQLNLPEDFPKLLSANNVFDMATTAKSKAKAELEGAKEKLKEKTLQLSLCNYGLSVLKRKRDEVVANRNVSRRYDDEAHVTQGTPERSDSKSDN